MTERLQAARVRLGRPGLSGGFVTFPEMDAAMASRAPSTPSFITRVAEAGLSGETALSSMGPGLLKIGDHDGSIGIAAGGDIPPHSHTSVVATYFQIGDGVNVIPTGIKGYMPVPFAGTIKKWMILGELVNGTITIDVWKRPYANYPPTSGQSITASDKPMIGPTASNKNSGTALTGWTTSVAVDDIFGFNVDAVSLMTKVTIYLYIERTV